VLRVVYPPDGGHAIVGSLRLYKAPFTDSVVTLSAYNPARIETYWICGGWDAPQRTEREVTQSCWLYNPACCADVQASRGGEGLSTEGTAQER